jgi:TPR repeat protein
MLCTYGCACFFYLYENQALFDFQIPSLTFSWTDVQEDAVDPRLSALKAGQTPEGFHAKLQTLPPTLIALSEDAHKAMQLEASGNVDAAIKLAEQCANRGCTYSMTLLAQIYHEGRPGKEQDRKKAWHWFKRCADNGPSEFHRFLGIDDESQIMCMNVLGQLYRDGLGVDRNLDEAEKWLKAAAEARCPISMNAYSAFLLDFRQGQQAQQESFRWLKASAEAGYRYVCTWGVRVFYVCAYVYVYACMHACM